MAHKQSVSILAALLRPENDARPTFLLGAGASFSSGIPLAGESVKRLARQVYAEIELGRRVLPEQIKTSEWLAWLQAKSWFIHGDERLAENFPLIIEQLLKPEAYRRRVLLDLVNLRGELGEGYRALSELVLRGLAGTVLTTNFDICLPKALNDKRPHIRHVFEVNRSPEDFNEFNPFARAQIVWLHGKAEQYTDRNLIDETKTLDSRLLNHLTPLLNATPLVVIGYRGAEPSVTESLLGASSGVNFRQGIYWCIRKGETPHPNVDALAHRLGANFQFLEIDGFDELLIELNAALVGVQRFVENSAELAPPQFDDQAVETADWTDIDADLALATMKQYCEKLERGAITSIELRPLMRELGLLVERQGKEYPSAGCILLFGRDPEKFFRHAIVSATTDGKKRRVFGGNLLNQYKSVLEWLEEDAINPTLKVKRGRRHEAKKSYSERALVELLVNMLVHRDYEISKPALVEVMANQSIRFSNPAGKLPASARLKCNAEGVFSPIPEFSELRNRALCDVFFGISAMERAGTGLVDAEDLSRQRGGGATFAFPPSQDSFVGELFRPESSAGSQHVAKDTRPIGTYLINMLPFVSMPSAMTRLKVEGGWRELEQNVALDEAGEFFFERTGDLWSFAPPAYLEALFAPVLKAAPEQFSISQDIDDVLHKKVAWLIRRHFERHLLRFENDGLVIEKGKARPAKRAYFQSLRGKDRVHVYDTPNRKNVRRGVAKKRGDDAKPYFECEGFGYEIVTLGPTWGVRVKPFYMFTKQDGITPLPGYLRTRRSVRRIRLDRNANVESDLVFWGRFLSKGEQTINIGDDQVPDLLLDGSFYTVDVQEGGMSGSELITKDKHSA